MRRRRLSQVGEKPMMGNGRAKAIAAHEAATQKKIKVGKHKEDRPFCELSALLYNSIHTKLLEPRLPQIGKHQVLQVLDLPPLPISLQGLPARLVGHI